MLCFLSPQNRRIMMVCGRLLLPSKKSGMVMPCVSTLTKPPQHRLPNMSHNGSPTLFPSNFYSPPIVSHCSPPTFVFQIVFRKHLFPVMRFPKKCFPPSVSQKMFPEEMFPYRDTRAIELKCRD